MDSAYHLTLTDNPDPSDAQVVRAGLESHHAAQGVAMDWRPLALFLRDAQGSIVGGLTGGTYWGWLYVARLWVDASLRGQGCGSRLLGAAEEEARRRGCHHAYLDTQDFEALPFYRKHGYRVYGELHDIPVGHIRYSLQKEL